MLFRDLFNKANKTAKEFGESAGKFTMDHIDRANEGLTKWQEDRTSVVGGDSVEAFLNSDNPLVELEKRKIPKHVTMHLIHLFTAAGVFTNADQITQFTRAIMDNDSGAVQQTLRKVFSPEEAREISLWMDTSPGAEYAGGWAHRLDHGHDVGALIELSGEYGLTGAAEWANHVWLRDFWTPHGVPYLPVGSSSAYEWLIEQGVSPSTALSLLTVNAAEAATGLLMFSAAKRIYSIHQIKARIRNYKNGISKADQLIEAGREPEALRLIQNAEIHSSSGEHTAHLRLNTAIFCLTNSMKPDSPIAREWGDQAYHIAYELCRSGGSIPETILYHGNTLVSFHGLAATILAASWSSHVQQKTVNGLTIEQSLLFGIKKFRELAHKQVNPRLPKVNQSHLYGNRPLSALTNQFMALELTLAVGSVDEIEIDPIMLREELMAMLEQIREQKLLVTEAQIIDRIQENIERLYPMAPKRLAV